MKKICDVTWSCSVQGLKGEQECFAFNTIALHCITVLVKISSRPLSEEELQKRHREARERHALKAASQTGEAAAEPNPDVIKGKMLNAICV